MAEDSNSGAARNSRPESTLAMDFSSALDGAFNLSGELPDLQENVEQKKKAVTSQSQELEEIEARLKATEERLKRAGMETSSTSVASGQRESAQRSPQTSANQTAQPRSPGTAGRQPPTSPGRAPPGAHNPAMRSSAAGSSLSERAPTPLNPSRTPAMPGALPESPGSTKEGRSSRRG
ncbi:MAG: hypothetical protein M1828_004080 [Chrysothrix sp. TS-e1954]|nr:MAG: hypothetical protein M1828_004080 [Chrysothrix sp. TS-e1954]